MYDQHHPTNIPLNHPPPSHNTHRACPAAAGGIVHPAPHRGPSDGSVGITDRYGGFFTRELHFDSVYVTQNVGRGTFTRIDHIDLPRSQRPPGGNKACLPSLTDFQGVSIDAAKGEVGGCRDGGSKGGGGKGACQACHGLCVMVAYFYKTTISFVVGVLVVGACINHMLVTIIITIPDSETWAKVDLGA